MRKAILLALIFATTFVPALGSADHAKCPGAITGTTRVSGDYYYSTARVEIWKEDNGWPGIQVSRCYNPDYGYIEADICVTGQSCPVPDSRGAPAGLQELS